MRDKLRISGYKRWCALWPVVALAQGEGVAMRKIRFSKGTWTVIIVSLVVVFLGGAILATGKGVGEILGALWDKFSVLLGGDIS